MNYIAKHKMQDGEYIAYDISTSNFSVIDLNNVEEIHYSNVEDINNAWDFIIIQQIVHHQIVEVSL